MNVPRPPCIRPCPCTLHLTLYVHTATCALYTVHSKPHIVHCTLITLKLHTANYALSTDNVPCTLHFTLHVHTAKCALYTVQCTLQTKHITLQNALCITALCIKSIIIEKKKLNMFKGFKSLEQIFVFLFI